MQSLFIIVVVVTCKLLVTIDAKRIRGEVLFNPTSKDFSKAVESKVFVDKSLLIREMFLHNFFRVLITAPPSFGKSTNMDMVRRFLEIPVDERGNTIEPNTTFNYQLFQNNSLKICEHKTFFRENFGKYPVLYMDFSVLREVTDEDHMMFLIGTVVQRVYLHHNYLIHDTNLMDTSDSKTLFMKFCHGHVILTSLEDVKSALVSLLDLLYRHYKTKVFVFIDDYDAHIQTLLFKRNSHLSRIIIFIDRLIEDLLYCEEEYIQGYLVTGVMRVRERGKRITGICHFRYLLDHPFSKYYGFTEQEVDTILNKVNFKEDKDKIKQDITEDFRGYTINNQNITVYNPLSVLTLLQNKITNKPANKWSMYESELKFKPVFTKSVIKDELIKLLEGQAVWAKIGDAIFNDDIVNLNDALHQASLEQNLSIDLFKVLLYFYGFLSVTDDNYGQSIYRVRIPNKEVLKHFSSSLGLPRIYDYTTPSIHK